MIDQMSTILDQRQRVGQVDGRVGSYICLRARRILGFALIR